MSSSKERPEKRTRFAIYARYSSEMQNELSLEAQEARCRDTIAQRGGVVVSVFKDSAKTGWSLERDGFIEMRSAAEHGRFDAIMFWKFDRLARDHDHAVMIKMLLRHEYGLKLYCVEGFSEDENSSPYSALMEQMLAVFSAFYSKNLSSETKRGKRQRAIKGQFNGSKPPLGYDLVTIEQSTDEHPAGLYLNPRQAAIVRHAFRLYATGSYSDSDIARWMNQWSVIQKLRAGKKPVDKEMIRDVLQNRVYTGRVRYTETIYRGTLGQRRGSKRHNSDWFDGKHDGFIEDDLYEACQVVRAGLAHTFKTNKQMRTYILHDRLYCARCVAIKPADLTDERYGKMRPGWNEHDQVAKYRCLCRDRGYNDCGQPYVKEDALNEQVVQELSHLRIPTGFRERVERAVQSKIEHADALARIEELKAVVERINFSWEQGFLSPDEYTAKLNQLRREMDSLRPVDYDELMEAADLIKHFSTYWQKCETVDQPEEARKQLLAKIVDRVFVYDQKVIAITLYGDFSIILDEGKYAPKEIIHGVTQGIKKGTSSEVSACAQDGDDGVRTRDLCLDRAIC